MVLIFHFFLLVVILFQLRCKAGYYHHVSFFVQL